ncbi:MAG: hypothetical protein J6J35_02120 [Alphaproteobacteria bacterium]|nr:hypothetical protein [Alphaproteobacteria bacterium]MBP3687145.1 hypothetical protein [Alphaproteobacteria bacterium]
MNKLKNIMLVFSSLFLFSCNSTSDVKAVNLRYCEPRFRDMAPIELNVEKVDIISEFVPSFTRPNVEHLFPVSIEKAAKLWAEDRLKADGFSSNRVAQYIIKDASVTEEVEKSEEFLQKDRLKYRANLSVVLKITDKANLSAAETSINAWRELRIPVDTDIAEKERYWNDMVQKLFDQFNVRMEQNIHEYLNMYVRNNNSVKEYN